MLHTILASPPPPSPFQAIPIWKQHISKRGDPVTNKCSAKDCCWFVNELVLQQISHDICHMIYGREDDGDVVFVFVVDDEDDDAVYDQW